MNAEYLVGAISSLAADRLSRLRALLPRALLRTRPMTAIGWLQILVFFALVVARDAAARRLHVPRLRGRAQPLPRVLGPVERAALSPRRRRRDARSRRGSSTRSRCSCSAPSGCVVTYLLQRLQHVLAVQPAEAPAPSSRRSAFNTAASFTTNTNWQSYSGESTMSYLTQMAGLAWHNFTSAAAGIGVALAVARGLTRRPGPRRRTHARQLLGRSRCARTSTCSCRCRSSFALVLVSQGVMQNFAAYREVTTLEGGKQLLAMGPVASQEAIKELGTNGGGFFNANSAHPFENPTPLTNFIEMFLIFAIPAALTYTYGRMARDQRQGWAVFAAMAVLFFAGVAACYCGRGARRLGRAWRARSSASASPPRRCSPPSPPTPRAARSTPCTTASRRSAAWCRSSTSSSARSSSAASAPGSTACSSSSSSRCSSPASWSAARRSTSARRSSSAR